MLHSQSFARLLALLLASGLGLTACKSEKTTTVYQQIPGTSGGFTGIPLYQTSLASDGNAFSESGMDVTQLRRFDSGRGESIFLFEAFTGGENILFASHFNGASLTAPVELRGANQNPMGFTNLNQAFVAFLFPENERNGDAVVCFLRMDLDDGGTNASANPNRRLYVSYFDRTFRSTALKSDDPSVKQGFETDAQPIDLTDDDEAGADVALAGFLSGGTLGGGAFTPPMGSANVVRQGDTTPFLAVVWAQASSGAVPVRMHARTFDLSDANTGNQFGTTAEVGLDAGAGALDPVETGGLNVIDEALFFRRTDGTDTPLLGTVFDETAGTFIANALVLSPFSTNADTAELPGTDCLFGEACGLSRVLGLFRFTGGTQAGEISLYAFQLDAGNPTSPFSPTLDRVELDAGTGTGPYDVTPSGTGSWAVMNRTGEWLLAGWIQDQDSATTVPALWVNAIQTPRVDAPPPLTGAVSGAYRVDLASSTDPGVADFTFQSEVAYAGFQSARNVVNLAWHQDSGPSLDTLRFNGITVTPGTPPSVARGSETTVDFNDGTLLMPSVLVLDGGGAGGTPGAPILYYVRDARPSVPTSKRAYQYRSGAGEIEVGTLAGTTAATYHPCEAQSIRAMSAPRNRNVAAYPDWAGNVNHVFIQEWRFLDSAGSTALRHRLFRKNSTAPGGADRFVPAADGATPPFTVDTGADQTSLWLGAGLEGERAGVFFAQGNHVWYNEFDPAGSAWYVSPALVDDLWPQEALLSGVMMPFRRDDPDDLGGIAVWWTKFFSGPGRLFIRLKY